MVRFTINDQMVDMAEGRTLLEACREYGIHVPTLCYYPALEPYGGCRLCMVEVHPPDRPSRLVAACVYPCEEGLLVSTDSLAVRRSRRFTAELLMANVHDCPQITLLAKELGVEEVRYKNTEVTDCVLCALCVRACNEIVGVSAISLTQRGMSKKVSTPFEISSSVCIGCGTCVLICPTGRLSLSDVSGPRSVHVQDTTYEQIYCRADGDKDMKPYFVQDIAGLLE